MLLKTHYLSIHYIILDILVLICNFYRIQSLLNKCFLELFLLNVFKMISIYLVTKLLIFKESLSYKNKRTFVKVDSPIA